MGVNWLFYEDNLLFNVANWPFYEVNLLFFMKTLAWLPKRPNQDYSDLLSTPPPLKKWCSTLPSKKKNKNKRANNYKKMIKMTETLSLFKMSFLRTWRSISHFRIRKKAQCKSSSKCCHLHNHSRALSKLHPHILLSRFCQSSSWCEQWNCRCKCDILKAILWHWLIIERESCRTLPKLVTNITKW